jgi:hypothetical protein
LKGIGAGFSRFIKLYDALAAAFGTLEAKTYSTQELLNTIANLQLLIPEESEIRSYYIVSPPAQNPNQPTFYIGIDPATLPGMIDAMQRMKAQLAIFRRSLEKEKAKEAAGYQSSKNAYPDKSGGAKSPHVYNQFNSFLKIASHTAEGSAGIEASAIAAYASSKINGKYKKTAYRYQTFSPDLRGRGTLIYTQDTSITYRLATIEAGAGATFLSRNIERDLVHHGMTYQSACAYWLYEEAVGHSGAVRPRPGSGLNYGASIRVEDLVRCINEIKAQNLVGQIPLATLPPTVTSRKLIFTLARYLRISFNYLIEFLSSLDSRAVAANFPVPVVLLESNFKIPIERSLTASRKTKSYQIDSSSPQKSMEIWRLNSIRGDSAIKGFSDNLDHVTSAYANCQQYLQTIRIRARTVDYTENTYPFKLGASLPGVDALGLGITLTKIENVGQEGVIELVYRDYMSTSEDLRVPPTALFYQ